LRESKVSIEPPEKEIEKLEECSAKIKRLLPKERTGEQITVDGIAGTVVAAGLASVADGGLTGPRAQV
jgi:hypothetical protein